MRATYAARERSRAAWRFLRRHPGRVRAAGTVVALLLLAIAFVGPYLAGDDEARHLSAYADGAQDLSRFRDEIALVSRENGQEPAAVATSPFMLEGLADPKEHVLFVFGVEKSYTDGETRAIREFVEAGGTLVLANDVGNANPLSQELGVVFFDKAVLDRQSYLDNPKLVVVDVPFAGRSFRLVLNTPSYATVVAEAGRVSVLASSSTDSFIDVDDDGEIDVRDTPGPFPLVMETTLGEGRVVVIADTGLFTNEMQAIVGFENGAFARALAERAVGGGGKPLIDESRHVAPPAARGGNAALRLFVLATSTPVLRAVLGVGALVVVGLAVWLTRESEDWTRHAFDVGHEVPAPETLRATPERLSALAARAVCERYNVPFEYLETASVDELVRMTGDRELAVVAKGLERPADTRAFLRKIGDAHSTEASG